MALINLLIRRFLWSPWAIPACILISFCWGLGWVPLFDLDEGAFTEATREMLHSGVFSATYLDGEPRYDKPIFFYWLQVLSIKSLGFNEWAFRIPSVVMASLWAWAIYCFMKEFVNKQRAHVATLFMINSLWVALIARSAIADATLNLFLTLAMFDIWRYFTYERQKYIWRVYLWMALGTLTKGPIAVAVPLVVSLLFLLSTRAEFKKYKGYVNPVGWLIYCLTVAPWLIAVYFEQGDGFFQGFIVEHNLKRFSDTRENHGGSIFYYVATLPLVILPLSGLFFLLLKRTKKILTQPIQRYFVIWFAIIFTLFSFSKTQLPHYVLNGCIPLFLMFSLGKGLSKKHHWLMVFPIALGALLFLLPHIVGIAADDTGGFSGATLSRHAEVFDHAYTGFALLLLVCLAVIAFFPRVQIWQRLVVSGLILNLFVFTSFARIISGLQQQPVHNIIAYLQENAPQKEVVAYKMHMPSFSVYRNRITPLRAPTPGEWAITRVDRLKSLDNAVNGAPVKILHTSGGLVLLEVLPSPTKPSADETNFD